MVYASSASSGDATATTTTAANMKATADKLRMRSNRPQIRIVIDGAEDSWVPEYSTLDRIEGNVFVTCPLDTNVDTLSIDFIGTSNTFVEKLSTATALSGRTEAFHQFLKLSQPIPDSAWPSNRILEAGRTYEFKFLFVVPQQLLSRVCRHTVASALIQQDHIRLPPSLGDSAVSGRGRTLLDDFSPDMARIKYAIAVAVHDIDPSGGPPLQPVIKTKKVRIVPAVEEQPPLTVDGPNSDYKLRAEKDIRKNIFGSKQGNLVVEVAQPRALRLPSYKSEKTSVDSTMATVNLRFDPADDKARPPKLSTLNTKFKVTTFFASAARGRMPSRHDMQWDWSQGAHSESMTLASRCVSNVDWAYHSGDSRPGSPDRRSSTVSASSIAGDVPEPSGKFQGKGFYTARIVVPISLPTNKAWVPTFHSCLISRVYALSIHLNVASGNLGGIDLKVPVQISSEGNPAAEAEHRDSMTLEEQAIEALEADDVFLPMTSNAAMADAGRITPELPPEYDAFTRSRSRIPIAV